MPLRYTAHRRAQADPSLADDFSPAAAQRVRRFHAGFAEYAPTPLVSMPDTAAALGLGALWVKDESRRFGLNAFKALGASWAIGSLLGERAGLKDVLPADLERPELKRLAAGITFVTATDGNHGHGVAWTARRLGARCEVFMPKGSSPRRVERIRAQGALVTVTDVNYDAAVTLAMARARQAGALLVQDTSREGYEEIPRRIMQGYTTMGLEALEQLGGQRPTHVLLQAGVGSMAAAMAAFFAAACGPQGPKVIVVEADAADCLRRTAEAADGRLHAVGGSLDTIMAGLACGEPCSAAWPCLDAFADGFAAIPDGAAALGMRMLGNPAGNDPRVISGESGAAGMGLIAASMRDPALRERMGLGADARVLLLSTEGDTDPEHYRKVVWDGTY